jgi:hypothetical protein
MLAQSFSHSSDTEEGTELEAGEAALAVGFETPGDEGGTRGILPRSGQQRGEFIGDLERDVHI